MDKKVMIHELGHAIQAYKEGLLIDRINFIKNYTSYNPLLLKELSINSRVKILLAGSIYLYYFSTNTHDINLDNYKNILLNFGGMSDLTNISVRYVLEEYINRHDLVVMSNIILDEILDKDKIFITTFINNYKNNSIDSKLFKQLYEKQNFQLTLNF